MIFHQFVEKRGNRAAGLGEARVFVEASAATREVSDEGVYEYVCGPRVKSKDLRRFRVSGNDSDVSDAAEIQRDAAQLGMMIEEIIEVRNKRGPLAAESYVRGTKIRNGGDTCTRGDDGTFADLECGGGGLAEIGRGLALMKDRLAVIANEADARRSDLQSFACCKDGIGVNVPEAEVQLAEFTGGDRLLVGDAQDFFAKSRGEIEGSVAD